MKILVTGGAGYIGSHTVVEFLNNGYDVVVVDNLSNSQADVIDRIEQITNKKPTFYQYDLCDKNKVEEVFNTEKNIDAVVHFAAYKAVGVSVKEPLMYYQNNLVSLLNLMDVMHAHGTNNIVFSSSCTVYGQPDVLPVNEQAPIKKANSPYGNTKQIAEEILTDFCHAKSNYQAIALRYFNPIGAHESALIGELPLGVPDNLVPYITQTAYGLRDQLSVFGDNYNTPDGSAIRDYIHVVDLAKAHLIAIERLIQKKNNANFEFFNIGTGTGYSVLELVHEFERVSGQKLNYKIVDRREGDVEQVWADPKIANDVLGWKAEKNLSEMLDSAWKWEKYYRNKLQK